MFRFFAGIPQNENKRNKMPKSLPIFNENILELIIFSFLLNYSATRIFPAIFKEAQWLYMSNKSVVLKNRTNEQLGW